MLLLVLRLFESLLNISILLKDVQEPRFKHVLENP